MEPVFGPGTSYRLAPRKRRPGRYTSRFVVIIKHENGRSWSRQPEERLRKGKYVLVVRWRGLDVEIAVPGGT